MDSREIRELSKEKAFHSFGTAYIFRERAVKYSSYLNILKFSGILIPVSIGAITLGYGVNADVLKWSIIFAIPLSMVQLVFTTLSIVYKWEDELNYSYESASENIRISEEFENIIKFNGLEILELRIRYEKNLTRNEIRDFNDDKHNITTKEERKGMRYALRYYQKTCVGCNNVPQSMISTNCNICGNF